MYSTPDLKTGIRKIKGKIAILNITSFCNANCIFCSEGYHANPVNVNIAVIKETTRKLKSKGVREINFMGGETTLRHDFEDILKFIHGQGMRIYLVTNGIRFSDSQFAKRILKYLGSVEISLHASTKKMYEDIMGVDAFDKALSGIDNIKKYNKCVALFFNFVPNSINFSEIVDVLRLLRKIMGRNRFLIHIKTLNIEGKVEHNTALVPDYGKLKNYLKKAIKYALKNDIGIVISRFPLCIYDGFEYLSLELPLGLRENSAFFYNNRMLAKNMNFEHQSILDSSRAFQAPACLNCSLKKICPGLDSEYLKIKKNNTFLIAQNKTISSVIEKMINYNYFFKMDYSYHSYPFKVFSSNSEHSKKNKLLAQELEAIFRYR